MNTTRLLSLFVLLLSSLLTGCGGAIAGWAPFGGANIETNKTVAKPPANVTVFVSVEDAGDPVDHLDTKNFQIYENDVALDSGAIGLKLLSRNDVAAGYTILLLDLSGNPEPSELKRIGRGAAHFVEKVSTTQPVTVVAFDGSERAREVARFARVETSTKRPLPDLAAFLSPDSSRDLHSALLSALQGLTASLKQQKGEMRYGTIVTLVRGPDLAGRRDEKSVRSAMLDSGYEFYSISPEELSFGLLSTIGKDDDFTYPSIDTLPMRFQDLGMRVRAAWQSHYLLTYCSPGRAGVRKLKIKVDFESSSGAKRSATSKSKFDSTGFQGGCEVPNDKPKDEDPATEPAPPADSSPSPTETSEEIVPLPASGMYE